MENIDPNEAVYTGLPFLSNTLNNGNIQNQNPL